MAVLRPLEEAPTASSPSAAYYHVLPCAVDVSCIDAGAPFCDVSLEGARSRLHPMYLAFACVALTWLGTSWSNLVID